MGVHFTYGPARQTAFESDEPWESKKPKDWQKEAEHLIERELVDLGLITLKQIRQQPADKPAFKEFFMHGVGHPLGLDVHDVVHTIQPIQAGWVMTVEPGIYIRSEGLAVRLENNVLVTEQGPVDLMANIPIEPDEIEDLMQRRSLNGNGHNGKPGRDGRARRRPKRVISKRRAVAGV